MAVEVLRYAAFTRTPDGGNPAGVVLDADGLSETDMAAIAAEVGYSETAFLTGLTTAGRDAQAGLRYFSPRREVAFCGHATIATGVALAERRGTGTFRFDTRAGEIVVETAERDGYLEATLTSVATRTRPADDEERSELLAALRIAPTDLDPELPVHVPFAGNHHPVVPVATRERLAALDYDHPALLDVMDRRGWTTVHVTWRERPDRWHARDPFPVGGVVEDPATGAAAAAFGGYVRALGLLPVPSSFTIVQGEDMGRPSLLRVELRASDLRSRVSGSAVPITRPES